MTARRPIASIGQVDGLRDEMDAMHYSVASQLEAASPGAGIPYLVSVGAVAEAAPDTDTGGTYSAGGRLCPAGARLYLPTSLGIHSLVRGVRGTIALRTSAPWASNSGAGNGADLFEARTYANSTNDPVVKSYVQAGSSAATCNYKVFNNVVAQSSRSCSPIFSANEPIVVVARWDATTPFFSIQTNAGTGTTGTTAGLIMPNPTRFSVGYISTASLAQGASIGPLVLSPDCITGAEETALLAADWSDTLALLASLPDRSSIWPFTENGTGYMRRRDGENSLPLLLAMDGSSLLGSPLGPLTVAGLADQPHEWWNLAVGGQTTPQMTADAAAQVDPLLARSHGTPILVAWEWLNDSSALSTRMANMMAYCEARRAAGWRVVVLTNISNVNETSLNLAGANTYIRANWASFADALADVGALEHFVAGSGAYSDPIYYNSGGVHLTATGYAALAPIVVVAIESLL